MFNFKTTPQQNTFKAYGSIKSIANIIDVQLPAYGNRTAIRFDKGDTYGNLGFDAYLNHIKAMVQFFSGQNVEQKVVATFCKNRIEWDMVGMAAFYRGNILFPLDTKTNQAELEHLLKLNPPDYMLVSKAELQRMRMLISQLELNTIFIVADLIDVFEDDGHENVTANTGDISVASIVETYDPEIAIHYSTLLDNADTILGHYPTSGTTSLPKVVTISHGNIVAEVNEAMDVINLRHNEDLLNIGPYTHIATLVEFLVTKTRGFCVTYFTREPDDDDVLEDEIKKLKSDGVRIKALMAVPKFWIYLMKEVLEEMKNKPVLNDLYKHLISIEKSGKLYDISTLDKAKLAAMKILLRNKLGGYFSYGISSSMKLDGAIVEIFGKLGVTVIDIYGATECSGIISRNRLNDINPGSCGRVIEVLQYRLAQQQIVPGIQKPVGLLEVKGPTVSQGYLGQKSQTVLSEDGFYPTGDLCWLDDEGWLHIVGREKELTRWKDGTYIDPQYLSNLMVRSIFIKDAMVTQVNPEDDFLSVYVFPDVKRLEKDPEWQKQTDTGVSFDEALRHQVEKAIDYTQSVANTTARLSTEHIYLLPQKLARTPTHKIKFIVERERLHLARKI
jgi:long-chain acyl-CoA synthetase